MYRRFCRYGAFVAIVTGSTFFLPALSAQHLIDGDDDGVSRVIQLRNKIEDAIDPVADVTSRAITLAENPLAEAAAKVKEVAPKIPETAKMFAAPKVAFDEIESAPISGPVINGPVVGTTPRIASLAINPPMPPKTQEPVIMSRAPIQTMQKISYARQPIANRMLAAPMMRSESTPVVTTQIMAPEFINVGEIAPVRIDVRNPGKTTLYDVQLIAMLPEGVTASSDQGIVRDGECTFDISSLQPGES
jgi:uncharacterized repeat protein (TIGR01451 family)